VDGVGDALACTPLIAALRDAGHAVSALLTTRNAGIFAPGALENVHVVERIPWPQHGYTPETWKRALAEAVAQRYDVALIPSEEPQAYTFAKLAGIGKRVGFFNGIEKPFKSLWARMQVTRGVVREASLPMHPEEEARTLFALGEGLHDEPEPTKDVQRLRPLLVDAPGGTDGSTLIQLTPKWLGSDRTAEQAGAWIRTFTDARPSIVIAAETEREEVAQIAEFAGVGVAYFQSLRPWVNAIADAALLITPDTGAAHVAGMTGTPVVDVFENEDFQRHTARWAPWAAPMRLISYPRRMNSDFGVQLLHAAELLKPESEYD
jgi:ADP-heptose:LPS heptosyltransferase